MGVQEGDHRSKSGGEATEPAVPADVTSLTADRPDPAEAETVQGSSVQSPPAGQPAGGSAPSGDGKPDAADSPPGDDDLAAVTAQRDEYLDLARRTQADFENFRKRSSRELAETRARATADVVRELLPAVDNLERALEVVEALAETEHGQIAEGLKLVHDEFKGILERLGLSVLDPAGHPFDPNLHEAISTRPQDGTDPGHVLDVAQKGYLLGETVVRPARVVVSS